MADICPITVNVGGLPVGMQIIGKPFGEAEMLRVAYAYEQATGWEGKKAKI